MSESPSNNACNIQKVFLPSIRELFPEQYAPSWQSRRSGIDSLMSPNRSTVMPFLSGDHRASMEKNSKPLLPYPARSNSTVDRLSPRVSAHDGRYGSSSSRAASRNPHGGANSGRYGPDERGATLPLAESSHLSLQNLPRSIHNKHFESGVPTHSFTVLRSDPATSSLEHLASSTNLHDLVPHPSVGSSGVASMMIPNIKAAPTFRVEMQPTSRSAPLKPKKKFNMLVPVEETFTPIPKFEDVKNASPRFSKSPRSSRMSSLPVSTASSVVNAAPTTFTYTFDLSTSSSCHPLGVSNDIEGMQGMVRSGRKHTCQICHKRFNRPSSLRIHETTHTGAKPFRCQWPGCERLFNVNSNMRRHYRNHINSSQAKSLRSIPHSRLLPRYGDPKARHDEHDKCTVGEEREGTHDFHMAVDNHSEIGSDGDIDIDQDSDSGGMSSPSHRSLSSASSIRPHTPPPHCQWSQEKGQRYDDDDGYHRYSDSYTPSFNQSHMRFTGSNYRMGSGSRSPSLSPSLAPSKSPPLAIDPNSSSPHSSRQSLTPSLKPAVFPSRASKKN